MNKIFLTIIVVILLIGGIWFVYGSKTITGNVVNDKTNNIGITSNQEVQRITLSMKGNYWPNTIKVKEGIPVDLILDGSVRGCFRSFNIPELGISKYSSNPLDIIKFTPNKKGTFEFRCSMGMGTGVIIVE